MRKENKNSNRRKSASQHNAASELRNKDRKPFPDHLRRDDCAYMKGEVTHSCYGIHHVDLENGMKSLCTSRKMDQYKIGILLGDVVTVEIPMIGLSPTEKPRGRIVWRNH